MCSRQDGNTLLQDLAAIPCNGGFKEIEQILNLLISDYALSNQPNARKGGLIALAASALALGNSACRWSSDFLGFKR